MFRVARDASKVALWHLVEHMVAKGFRLLDVQYLTPHLQTFGAVEIPKSDYEDLLIDALTVDAAWDWGGSDGGPR